MIAIKLIAVDLDGTLLNSDHAISPANVEAVQACIAQGVQVVLVSARFLYSMRSYYAELGLTGPIICVDGAQVWSAPDGDLWHESPFSAQIAREIAALCDEQGWPARVLVGDTVYYCQRPGEELGEKAPGRVIVATNAEAVQGDPFSVLTYHPPAIGPLEKLISERYGDHCTTRSYFNEDGSARSLAIHNKATSKAAGVSIVLERLGIGWDAVLALGDGDNDLSMLEKAAIGVAMGNGTDAVKASASVVAPTNEDDGVAWALSRYVLGADA